VVCALVPLARYNSRTCTNPRLALRCAEFHLRCSFLLAGPPPRGVAEGIPGPDGRGKEGAVT
jgi:hypothetical protein